MTERLVVRAKAGVVFPRAAPLHGFVGYERVRGSSEPNDDDHVVPGGPRYRLKSEPEEVPNNSYYRRALVRGDIEAVAPAAEGDETVTEPASEPTAPEPAAEPAPTTPTTPEPEQPAAEVPSSESTTPEPELQPASEEPAPEQPVAETPAPEAAPAEPPVEEGTP